MIFLTAKSDTDSLIEGFEAGGVDYLSKPFEMAELELTIKQAFRTQELEKTEQIQNYHDAKDSEEIEIISGKGVFDEIHKLIDLAGLVTPEIIPIIRNEKELGIYLDAHGADYLMTFPGWYLDLAKGKEKAYDSNEQGGSEPSADPMTVYYWKIQK